MIYEIQKIQKIRINLQETISLIREKNFVIYFYIITS